MMLSGRDGAEIARKLGAPKPKNKRHRQFTFRVSGVRFTYGVSHDAHKENQYHIAQALGISVTQAKQLATCTMSVEEFKKTSRILH